MGYQQKAIKDRIIYLNRRENSITYLDAQKTRSLNNPEERVQLNTFLSLIYDYNYPVERIKVCQLVKMGSASKEADIVVYSDDACQSPFIIVECKKQGVSAQVFEEAIEQGFSYASATLAKYVWTTDGHNNAYYEVWPHAIGERKQNQLSNIPAYQEDTSLKFKVKKQTRKLFRTTPGKTAPLKRLFQQPLFLQAFSYALLFVLFLTIYSKMSVMHFPEFYQLTKSYWPKYGIDFRWIYNIINFMAAGSTILLAMQLNFIPLAVKPGKTTWVLLSTMLYIPVWFVGSEFRGAWWNWQHYSDMSHQTWIYLQPALSALPIQMILLVGLVWIAEYQHKHHQKSVQARKVVRR
ncbi:type I restriction enzyme HsdR N-terminal domain-containing protein [Algivirga pacifica]|uniref:Type I restriction enzyme R protein N-terminal domain-containing protein n=1 Tax=Algivirga pacifica TaxID=1162670 RepID=A0ABP9CZ81_9BACT